MSDDAEVKTTEEQQVAQESPEATSEVATQNKPEELTIDREFVQNLFKKIETQNNSIQSLKEMNVDLQKKIQEATDKIKSVDQTVKENVSQVIGGYDYAEKLQNLTRDQEEQMYKENKEIYNEIKSIFKV